MRAIIFGTGSTAERLVPQIRQQYDIVGFLDNNKSKWGATFKGLPVHAPEKILDMAYDVIIVAALTGFEPVKEQLISIGVEPGKISTDYVAVFVKSRILFLEHVGELFEEKGIVGSVAEGGVFQGEFAKEINRVFHSHRLYLFDTFTGFDQRDVNIEQSKQFSDYGEGSFNMSGESIVMNKLPHPSMCIIKKGFFPESANDINKDEVFCFVNLDFDLYQPILAGLNFFAPRMVAGGIILVHDYFNRGFSGVKQAITDFNLESKGLKLFPIGDGFSVGIQF